jgi:hypothetical protein
MYIGATIRSVLPGHVLFYDPKIFVQVDFLNLYKYAGFDYLFLPNAFAHFNGI